MFPNEVVSLENLLLLTTRYNLSLVLDMYCQYQMFTKYIAFDFPNITNDEKTTGINWEYTVKKIKTLLNFNICLQASFISCCSSIE